jgi:HSP20 family protein
MIYFMGYLANCDCEPKSFLDLFNFPSSLNRYPSKIVERKNATVIEIDIPGFERNEIVVELKRENITVTAEKKESSETENSRQKIVRTFYVGSGIYKKDIKVSHKNGVLNIVVPRAEPKEDGVIDF